ncbi:methyltransferase domain-containing protein [[Eubacterium] cellulosolvens]
MILNVGCGEQSYGDVRCDIYPSKAVNVICDAMHLPFRNNSFEQVYSKTVFEHLNNPMLALQEQKRVLRNRSRIVLITDNAGYWRFYLFPNGNHLAYHQRENDKHYALYTKLHLENFFKDIKMQIVSIKFIEFGKTKLDRFVHLLSKIFWQLNLISYPCIEVVATK